MITESELRQRLAAILTIEEHGEEADWFAIARQSRELLQMLPDGAPLIVKAYLTDSDLRRASSNFARQQRSDLLQYLRATPGEG